MSLALPKRLTGQHPSVKRSAVQERNIAARINAKQVKGSGVGPHHKGDVSISRVMRLEAKTTKNKSFSVTTAIIDKIEGQALAVGELPVIEIELDNAGSPKSVAVVPIWALDIMLAALCAETEK